MEQIPESDWKIFRQLREVALERFCERVLAEVCRVAGENGSGFHTRYLAVFKVIDDRNEELALVFDNPRRSVALQQLVQMRLRRLLTDEEFARFRPETRETVELLLGHR
jgi:hypothetical protein